MAPLALPELLREYRAAALMSQEELAERSGVSARTIGDIETGISVGRARARSRCLRMRSRSMAMRAKRWSPRAGDVGFTEASNQATSGLARALLQNGKSDEAETVARDLLDGGESGYAERDAARVLAEIEHRLGENDAAALRLAQAFPEGDVVVVPLADRAMHDALLASVQAARTVQVCRQE